MISLARHIELLLLEHDCVIVPGFGGFIASHEKAQFDNSAESMFLPPYRTIGFNQQLQMNDGLLVQSYMSAYDASYPAACLQMEKEVDCMIDELDSRGVYELEGVGVLTKSMNQSISFSSAESGILTPSLYGLYSFGIKSLEDILKEEEINKALKTGSSIPLVDADNVKNETKKKDVVIHLRRRWIDVAVSTAAAVLLFFCFSYPALHNNAPEGDTCVAAVCAVPTPEPVKNAPVKVEEKKIIEADTHSNDNVNTEIEAKSATNNIKNENKAGEDTSHQIKFTIVLASYVSEANANDFINSMNKKGLTEARFVKKGKVSRILYSGYSSENDAHAALTELRKQAGEFAEAWVMELN